jgi:hypothetical protein
MVSLSVTPITSPSVQWNAFLSQLAVAENAAAQQFALISQGLYAEGYRDAAGRYEELAAEEVGHYERVSRACDEYIPPPATVLELYGGGLADASTSIVERMAVTHFAHETSALAFLGHIHGHIHELQTDPEWATRLRELCAGLLRDEVVHVRDGKSFVAQFIEGQSEAVKTQVRATVRMHRNFVIRTVRQVFRGSGFGPFVADMMVSYRRRCQAVTGDLLGDN